MAAPFILRDSAAGSTMRGANTLRGPGVPAVIPPRRIEELPSHLFRRIPILWQAAGEARLRLTFSAAAVRIANVQGETCWRLVVYGSAVLVAAGAGEARLPVMVWTADSRIRRYTEPEDLRLLGLDLEIEEDELVGV